MTLAHIGGLPVEETLMMVVPAVGIWASLALYELQRRLPRGRRARRCGQRPRSH